MPARFSGASATSSELAAISVLTLADDLAEFSDSSFDGCVAFDVDREVHAAEQ
jgi:hypothetical protein